LKMAAVKAKLEGKGSAYEQYWASAD